MRVEDIPKLIRCLEGEYYENLSSVMMQFLDSELTASCDYADSAKRLLDNLKPFKDYDNTTIFIEDSGYVLRPKPPLFTVPHPEYPYSGPLYMTKKDPLLGRMCGETLCTSKYYDKLIEKSERELNALKDISNVYELMPSFGDPKDSKNVSADRSNLPLIALLTSRTLERLRENGKPLSCFIRLERRKLARSCLP